MAAGTVRPPDVHRSGGTTSSQCLLPGSLTLGHHRGRFVTIQFEGSRTQQLLMASSYCRRSYRNQDLELSLKRHRIGETLEQSVGGSHWAIHGATLPGAVFIRTFMHRNLFEDLGAQPFNFNLGRFDSGSRSRSL
ncbi:hypothetical protein ElyMa_000315200 [Elysia marginata]|uniref:Uncharacterized protein n=1 Tax=Elysia marginata TaxID=1093978 RepID=A0AAV4FAS4_9GAST|nr:hypothetical protein ElyMa_000315200 [Elysia marginata]